MVEKASPIAPRPGFVDYLLLALATGIGGGALLLFALFLLLGPFHVIDLGYSLVPALLFDACLCLAFFVQHSGMIRQGVRQRISRVVSERYIGALFTIASGVAVLALLLLWQESGHVLAAAEGGHRWSFRAVFLLAVAVQVWGTWVLKSADLFGTKGLLGAPGPTPQTPAMVVRGPYRWVRHPLYATTLLMIWSYPQLTADRLLFNVLFTLWIVVGALLEERDLVAFYGQPYRDYQRRVPMLIPYRKPKAGGGAAPP